MTVEPRSCGHDSGFGRFGSLFICRDCRILFTERQVRKMAEKEAQALEVAYQVEMSEVAELERLWRL